MAEVIAFPARGDVFFDLRGDDRTLRVSWHPELKLVVLSLWRDGRCSATFRMSAEDVPQFVSTLVEGLAECIPPSMSAPRPGPRPRAGDDDEIAAAQAEPVNDPALHRIRE
jgi:hypothetical protein